MTRIYPTNPPLTGLSLARLRANAMQAVDEIRGDYTFVEKWQWTLWINEGFERLAVESEHIQRRAMHDAYIGVRIYGPWEYSSSIWRAEYKKNGTAGPYEYLKPTTLRELDIIDPQWQSTTGIPEKWYITDNVLFSLYPAPNRNQELAMLIYHHGLKKPLTDESSVCDEFPTWAHNAAASFAAMKFLEKERQFSLAANYARAFQEIVFLLKKFQGRQKLVPGGQIPFYSEV